jgi:hypothetical protein
MTGSAREMNGVTALDRRERHKKGKGLALSRVLVPGGRPAPENGDSEDGGDHHPE